MGLRMSSGGSEFRAAVGVAAGATTILESLLRYSIQGARRLDKQERRFPEKTIRKILRSFATSVRLTSAQTVRFSKSADGTHAVAVGNWITDGVVEFVKHYPCF